MGQVFIQTSVAAANCKQRQFSIALVARANDEGAVMVCINIMHALRIKLWKSLTKNVRRLSCDRHEVRSFLFRFQRNILFRRHGPGMDF